MIELMDGEGFLEDETIFELEECPSCGAPILYYQNVEVPMKYCKKTMKICYVLRDCKEGVEIKRVIGDNFIDFKDRGVTRVAGIKGFAYECEVLK